LRGGKASLRKDRNEKTLESETRKKRNPISEREFFFFWGKEGAPNEGSSTKQKKKGEGKERESIEKFTKKRPDGRGERAGIDRTKRRGASREGERIGPGFKKNERELGGGD